MDKNLVNSNNIEVVTSDDDLSLDFSTTVKQKIEQIEINKNNISNNTNDIANLKGKILWTNENPTTAFNQQNITLSSDDYDVLEWYYCYSTSADNTKIQKSTKIMKTNSVLMNITGYSTGITMRRLARYVNDTTYNVQLGKNGSNQDDATVCIPLFVVGYNVGI